MKIIPKNNEYRTFPQANDIYRVIYYADSKLYGLFAQKIDFLKEKIASRQIQYYRSAAEYLGLLYKNAPTDLAIKIFKNDKNTIFVSIVELILSNKLFYDYYKERNEEKSITDISTEFNLNYITAKRRCSTIKSWIKWCDIILTDNNVTVD